MTKSNAWESDLLSLVFNNTTASGIGDVTGLVGSSTAGVLYVSLHTADPGEAGNQTTSKAAYTSYARVSVARNSGQWLISGTAPTQVSNVNTITFPKCTGGSESATYIGIGTSASGAGKLLYSGVLASPLAISNNISPFFMAGAIILTEE